MTTIPCCRLVPIGAPPLPVFATRGAARQPILDFVVRRAGRHLVEVCDDLNVGLDAAEFQFLPEMRLQAAFRSPDRFRDLNLRQADTSEPRHQFPLLLAGCERLWAWPQGGCLYEVSIMLLQGRDLYADLLSDLLQGYVHFEQDLQLAAVLVIRLVWFSCWPYCGACRPTQSPEMPKPTGEGGP